MHIDLGHSGGMYLHRAEAFTQIAYNSHTRLKYLCLRLCCVNGKMNFSLLQPALRDLHTLVLEYSEKTHSDTIAAFFVGPGPRLRRLELSALDVLEPSVLEYAKHLCPGLTQVCLYRPLVDEDVGLCEADMCNFAMSYGNQLRVLEIFDTGSATTSPESFFRVLQMCTGLQDIFIERRWYEKPIKFLEALSLRVCSLRSLRFTSCHDITPYAQRMQSFLPNLRELHILIEKWEGTTGDIISCFGQQLRVLSVVLGTCGPFPEVFRVIGCCSELRELILQSALPVQFYFKDVVESMMKRVGWKLRCLSWSIPARFLDVQRPVKKKSNLGSNVRLKHRRWTRFRDARRTANEMEEFSGAELASWLWKYCKHLEFVCVQSMKPKNVDTTAYARAFQYLKAYLPNVQLVHDRNIPHWFGRSWKDVVRGP